ncbi:MAG: cell division protein ZapB [Thermoanaerobaculia bacterium]
MAKKEQNGKAVLDGTEEEEMLGRLSQRVTKAIATIQQLRDERDKLRKKLEETQAALKEREAELEGYREGEGETEQLREERKEIRSRIEKILGSLESLDEAEPA